MKRLCCKNSGVKCSALCFKRLPAAESSYNRSVSIPTLCGNHSPACYSYVCWCIARNLFIAVGRTGARSCVRCEVLPERRSHRLHGLARPYHHIQLRRRWRVHQGQRCVGALFLLHQRLLRFFKRRRHCGFVAGPGGAVFPHGLSTADSRLVRRCAGRADPAGPPQNAAAVSGRRRREPSPPGPAAPCAWKRGQHDERSPANCGNGRQRYDSICRI